MKSQSLNPSITWICGFSDLQGTPSSPPSWGLSCGHSFCKFMTFFIQNSFWHPSARKSNNPPTPIHLRLLSHAPLASNSPGSVLYFPPVDLTSWSWN